MRSGAMRGIVSSLAISASALWISTAALYAPAVAASEVKIGVPLPQTGGASRWGAFSLRGAQLAARQINEAGGVAGMKLQLIPADDQCVPAEGVSATQRLLNITSVDVILGPMCSSVAKALQPIIESAKIPMLLPATSDPEITYKAGVGGFKWTFRNYPTDENRALVLLESAGKLGVERMALLAIDNDFGRAAVEFNKKYQNRVPKLQFTSIDFFGIKETDFRPILSKIRAANAQVVMLYATAGDTIQVLGRQMREMGMAGKVRVMGIGDLTHPDNLKALGDVLEGAVESTLWVPLLDNARSRKFVSDYQAAYGGETPNFLAYSYWETTYLLAQVIRDAKSAKPEAIQKGLQAVRYESVLGRVQFDERHQANLPLMLLEVKGGQPFSLGNFYSQPQYPTK